MTNQNDRIHLAMRNIMVYVIAISLLAIGATLVKGDVLKCTLVNGMPHYQINCEGDSADAEFVLPNNMYQDATFLHIKIANGKTFVIDRANMFSYFRRLLKLHIVRADNGNNNVVNVRIANQFEKQMSHLRAELFNLPYLQELKIDGIKFNNTQKWDLPEHLEYLTITYAAYHEYDLSNLRYLIEVDFRHGGFIKLPLFRYPSRFLQKLYMNNNSLNEVTTNDIAKLCSLSLLHLDESSFSANGRYCECKRLHMWLDNLKNLKETQGEFQLNVPECHNGNDASCTRSELDFTEAMKQRELCLAPTEDE